jgi:hypothetical protein
VLVLLPFLLSLAFGAVGLVIVAKVALFAMRRLGLDLFEVLTWFGIAEDRTTQPSFGNKLAGGRTLRLAK